MPVPSQEKGKEPGQREVAWSLRHVLMGSTHPGELATAVQDVVGNLGCGWHCPGVMSWGPLAQRLQWDSFLSPSLARMPRTGACSMSSTSSSGPPSLCKVLLGRWARARDSGVPAWRRQLASPCRCGERGGQTEDPALLPSPLSPPASQDRQRALRPAHPSSESRGSTFQN